MCQDELDSLLYELRAARDALTQAEAFIKRRFPDEAGDALTDTHDMLSVIHHVLHDL